MSAFDDDLLAALRRSSDPADQQLAGLLGELSPTAGQRTGGPRATEALTSFLVGTDPGVARLTDSPVPDPDPDLVVELGRPTPRRRSMRSNVLVPFNRLLRMSLLAKVMLGATVVFTGAGAVAATATLQSDDGAKVVTASPAHDGDEGARPTDTEATDVVEEEEPDVDDDGTRDETGSHDGATVDEVDDQTADADASQDRGDEPTAETKAADRGDGTHDQDEDGDDRDSHTGDGDHADDYSIRTDPNHGVDFPYDLCDADHDGDGDHDAADDAVHDVDRDGDGDHDDADHADDGDHDDGDHADDGDSGDVDRDGDGDHDEDDHALEH